MIVNGTSGDDNGSKALIGTNDADTVSGEAGNDDLYSLGGNDILVGGLGNDTINGGAGVDLVSYAYANHTVSVTLGANGSGSVTAGNNDTDALHNIENIWGSSFGDWLFGNSAGNEIDGRGGDDWIQGGAGTDRLFGGSGSDTLDYTGSGAVTVDLATNAVSGGHAQGDVVSGFENVYGTAFNDSITGNAAANWLWGGQGQDTLRGGGGSDRLRGQEGADTLWGGSGADKFYIGEGESGTTAATRDVIKDLSEAEGDKIDLSGFRTGAQDWQFDFIGGDAFDDVHQVRTEISGGNTYVTASVDGGVDLSIKLEGIITLEANDFIL